MSNIFKFIIAAIAASISMNAVYANTIKPNHSKVYYVKNTQQQTPKTYSLTIDSYDPNQPHINIDGAVFASSVGKEATITDIHTTTPYKLVVTDEYLNLILKTDLKNPSLHVTIQADDGSIVEGWGHKFNATETIYEGNFGGFIVFN